MRLHTEVRVFPRPEIEGANQLIEQAVAHARKQFKDGLISKVILSGTPHFASIMGELAHHCMAKAQCLNVWGGCVSGILGHGQVFGYDPTLMIALFEQTQQSSDASSGQVSEIKISLIESAEGLNARHAPSEFESESVLIGADTLGLLNYGANYSKMPQVEGGRHTGKGHIQLSIPTRRHLTLSSEGLEFFSEAGRVSTCNQLFLIEVDGKPAAQALGCPSEQTRPVGLRLQILHDDGSESWVPLLQILPDGTLCLAAPVAPGSRVRLARRTVNGFSQESSRWPALVESTFAGQQPRFGILMAGMERSQLCHPGDSDVDRLLAMFPGTEWIGLFGQASWASKADALVSPPRNNRMLIALFD